MRLRRRQTLVLGSLPPAVVMALAIVAHVVHTIAGLPALEGVEQSLLACCAGRDR